MIFLKHLENNDLIHIKLIYKMDIYFLFLCFCFVSALHIEVEYFNIVNNYFLLPILTIPNLLDYLGALTFQDVMIKLDVKIII